MNDRSARSAALTRPAPRAPLISDGVMGMLLFVFTEAMMFAGLVSAHAIVRSRAVGEMWPPFGQPRLPLEQTALNTGALLLSGVILLMAQRWFRWHPARAAAPLLIAVALGSFFVAFQGVEWIALLREGLTLTSSTYGAFFYVIIGAHALHAVAAIACLTWAWWRLRSGSLRADQFATVSVFWYFVVLIWPLLYVKVYL